MHVVINHSVLLKTKDTIRSQTKCVIIFGPIIWVFLIFTVTHNPQWCVLFGDI